MAANSSPAPPSSRATHRHPVNRSMHEDAPPGARIADAVTSFLGSWRFIALQTVIVAIWIAGNVYLLFNFDPYPFILLNLAFSTQAAYSAPLILLAGNRQVLRDRMTLEHAAAEADKEDLQNQRLLRGSEQLAAGHREILSGIEGLERRILELESTILARLDRRAD